MNKIPDDMVTGTVHATNNCGDIEVIEYKAWDNVKIKFIETGSIVTSRSERVRNGKIKDLESPSVYGVGFVGYGHHTGTDGIHGKHSRRYRIWSNMFKRCYSGQYPTYKDCSVCEEWHNYQNFSEWYDKNYPNNGISYDLDKDIKIDGNKIYSPDTCLFVLPSENKIKAKAVISLMKSPSGENVEIYNLRDFCAKNNLNYGNLNEVKLGRRKSHKGWTKAD